MTLRKKKIRHLVTVTDLSNDEINLIYDLAADTKALLKRGIRSNTLVGHTLGMIFEKPSMRTRISFQTAMIQAGGHAIDIRGEEIGLGKRESVHDVAEVMSRYVDIIMIRTYAHKNVKVLARYSNVPVINGLSDYAHPCQALADVFTIREKLGSVEDRHLVFVGDGNNVARSLALLSGKLQMRFTLCCPEGHSFEPGFVEQVAKVAEGRSSLRIMHDPAQAVKDADVVYTDVWASMGQEAEAEARRRVFQPYQLNGELMAQAPAEALVMHCLPAHRGEEICDEVIDSPNSVVYDQAENRLHAQKGLLFFLLGVEGV
jgi:ornithine carbamoyltransferase